MASKHGKPPHIGRSFREDLEKDLKKLGAKAMYEKEKAKLSRKRKPKVRGAKHG